MGLHFSCNNKIFFLKNMALGCFPFLCLIGLNQAGQLLFLSIPADVKQMLSVKRACSFSTSEDYDGGLLESWVPLGGGTFPAWCLLSASGLNPFQQQQQNSPFQVLGPLDNLMNLYRLFEELLKPQERVSLSRLPVRPNGGHISAPLPSHI